MSQPAREFIVKIVELSLWSSDFLLGHLLLFILTPPILVPYIDKAHSTMLCKCWILLNPCARWADIRIVWLRPSKQIRAPLYSMKVRKQRRWMVIKYGIVYAVAAGAFAALIVLRE